MVISRRNMDNSNLFMRELKRFTDEIIVIIVKNHNYLPDLKVDNKIVIFLKEEKYDCETAEKLQKEFQNALIFFSDTMHCLSEPKISHERFSEKILKNLYQRTDIALHDAAKFASIVYIEIDAQVNGKNINTMPSDHYEIKKECIEHTTIFIHLEDNLSPDRTNAPFVVISANESYPDSMILLDPATPEFQEKTHIKEVICYPHII